jgi:phosphoribosylformimino-5-aminoimidazole carboxamide ribotide isomerase
LQDPDWLANVARRLPGKVVLGIDAKHGKVATEGWLNVSATTVLDLARQCSNWPLAALIYTDISRDGMLAGPNVEGLRELAAAVSLPVIASGGVTSLADIRRLKQLNLAGCIIGRALYEGQLDLSEVLSEVGGQT